LLKKQLRGKGLKLTWTDPDESMVEAWLSRGDRRLAEVIYQAWQRGAKFDAWKDQLNYQAWMDAFSIVGIDFDFYTHRERELSELLPWDHISTSVRKDFMVQDLIRSQEIETLEDCRDSCYACGVLPTFADLRREHPGDSWGCPDVSPRGKNTDLIQVALPIQDAPNRCASPPTSTCIGLGNECCAGQVYHWFLARVTIRDQNCNWLPLSLLESPVAPRSSISGYQMSMMISINSKQTWLQLSHLVLKSRQLNLSSSLHPLSKSMSLLLHTKSRCRTG
jgi:hypothetical protein